MADPITLAVAGILGSAMVGSSVYQGQEQKKAQKRALKEQRKAQEEATTMQQRQQRQSEEAMARANMQEPDVVARMRAAQEASQQGAASTMLTGSGGVQQPSSMLGRSTLLGE